MELFAYYTILFFSLCIATIIVIVSYIKVTLKIKKVEINVSKHLKPRKTEASETDMSDIVDGSEPIASLRSNVWTFTCGITSDLSTENTHVTMFASGTSSISSDISAPISENPNNHRRPTVLCNNDKLPKQTSTILSGKWLRCNIRITRVVFLVCTVFVVSWIPPWVCFFVAMAQNMSLNPVWFATPCLHGWRTFWIPSPTLYCTQAFLCIRQTVANIFPRIFWFNKNLYDTVWTAIQNTWNPTCLIKNYIR